MTLAKTGPLLLAASLAVLASGCSRRATSLPARSEPSRPTRTAEKLRVYKGPLAITVDPKYGYGKLEVAQTGEKSFALFISSDDVPGLAKLDKTQHYEVRYWYHDERLFADVMIGRGDLVSIRSSSGTILDLSRCTLHNLDMARRSVPIHHGLPIEGFLKAMTRDFPHPAFKLGGCVVDEMAPKEAPRYVCPRCDAAAKAWSSSKQ